MSVDSKQLRALSRIYQEAVYGGAKKEAPKDTRMVVTNADKKANTKAYQNMKAGVKGYKAADHMGEEKKAAKDYDGDGKVESGKDEYFGSKDKAIKKAMGKKSPEAIESKRRKDDNLFGSPKKESFSNWRNDLIEVSDTVGSGGVPLTDVQASKKVKEGKVNNKVVINPKLGEAIEQIGGELIEVHEDMEPNKKKKNCGCGQDPCVTYGKQDQLEVAMEKGKQAIGTLGATTKGTSYAEDKDWIQKAVKRPGAFTRKAKAAGMGVQQFAKNVDDNPGKYSTRTKKQANLAQTFASMKKEDVEEQIFNYIVESTWYEFIDEGYQRNPEKGEAEAIKKKREQKGGYDAKRAARMNDPKTGINSDAFKEFMRSRGM